MVGAQVPGKGLVKVAFRVELSAGKAEGPTLIYVAAAES